MQMTRSGSENGDSEKLEVGSYEKLYVRVVNAEAKPYCTLAWFPAKLV